MMRMVKAAVGGVGLLFAGLLIFAHQDPPAYWSASSLTSNFIGAYGLAAIIGVCSIALLCSAFKRS